MWDALPDSVWGGLHELKSPHAVVAWPEALPVAGAESDFRIALSILRDVADSLAEARHTSGKPAEVSVYISPAPKSTETEPAPG